MINVLVCLCVSLENSSILGLCSHLQMIIFFFFGGKMGNLRRKIGKNVAVILVFYNVGLPFFSAFIFWRFMSDLMDCKGHHELILSDNLWHLVYSISNLLLQDIIITLCVDKSVFLLWSLNIFSSCIYRKIILRLFLSILSFCSRMGG